MLRFNPWLRAPALLPATSRHSKASTPPAAPTRTWVCTQSTSMIPRSAPSGATRLRVARRSTSTLSVTHLSTPAEMTRLTRLSGDTGAPTHRRSRTTSARCGDPTSMPPPLSTRVAGDATSTSSSLAPTVTTRPTSPPLFSFYLLLTTTMMAHLHQPLLRLRQWPLLPASPRPHRHPPLLAQQRPLPASLLSMASPAPEFPTPFGTSLRTAPARLSMLRTTGSAPSSSMDHSTRRSAPHTLKQPQPRTSRPPLTLASLVTLLARCSTHIIFTKATSPLARIVPSTTRNCQPLGLRRADHTVVAIITVAATLGLGR